MKKLFALFALFLTLGVSQSNLARYVAIKETVLAAAAEKVTVQQPTGGAGKTVTFEEADIYCSVACTATTSQTGAAATTTALTPTIIGFSPPPVALAYSSSNVGSGTSLQTYYIAAGATLVLNMSNLVLPRGAGTGANLSIGTNSITGTARIQIQWNEQ